MTGAVAEVLPRGDAAFAVRFGDAISAELFAVVSGALAALDRARHPAVVDVVPGYASVLVVFDPGRAPAAAVRAFIERALDGAAPLPEGEHRLVELPVLYDPSVAPDLAPLAAEKGLSVEALVARHVAAEYRCHMLGFRPGFPFLGGLDPALAAPRLATPRPSVPAGSVGIGGRQTGVYPSAGPGGWRIIGRTPLALFDPARPQPFLLQPGDRVTFVSIDRPRFEALS